LLAALFGLLMVKIYVMCALLPCDAHAAVVWCSTCCC